MAEGSQDRAAAVLAGWVVAVALVGFSASQFRPGAWYAALAKPPWTPPDWVFGPVWTLLYVAMAVAGYRIFTRVGGLAGWLWAGQLVFNGLWSLLFFQLHLEDLAMVELSLLLALLLTLLTLLARSERISFWLLLPYALWVTYALTLNAAIVVMN